MPRILVISEFPTTSGGEKSFLSIAPYLRDVGFEIRVAAPSEGPFAKALRKLGLRRHDFDVRSPSGERLGQHQLQARLLDVIAEVQPDLVHANSLSMGRLLASIVERFRTPTVAHLRDILRLSAAAVQTLNRNTKLLAVSKATRNYHIAQGLQPNRVDVVYNGVDLQEFAPAPSTGWLHEVLGLDPSIPLIGSIGQLVMRKGHDVLAQAAHQIGQRHPNVHFVIIGQRYSRKPEAVEFEHRLRADFPSPGTPSHAHFLDWQDDVARCLREFALLVHPARQEPLGRVLLEAAASGVPIVATDVGGTREILTDDAALIVRPDHPQELAAAVCRLLDDPRLAADLSTAARRRMEDGFDVRAAADRLAHHYREVIASAQPVTPPP